MKFVIEMTEKENQRVRFSHEFVKFSPSITYCSFCPQRQISLSRLLFNQNEFVVAVDVTYIIYGLAYTWNVFKVDFCLSLV